MYGTPGIALATGVDTDIFGRLGTVPRSVMSSSIAIREQLASACRKSSSTRGRHDGTSDVSNENENATGEELHFMNWVSERVKRCVICSQVGGLEIALILRSS